MRQLLARRRVRSDCRVFWMKKQLWGMNCHWWPRECEGERAVMWSPYGPRVGDVVAGERDEAYVIVKVDQQSDPRDMAFVDVRPLGRQAQEYDGRAPRRELI